MSQDQILATVGTLFDECKDAEAAAGECARITYELQTLCKNMGIDTKSVYAEAPSSNTEHLYLETGAYSNHYALFLPQSDTVIDYTMRQFHPESEFPFVGTRRAWGKMLSKAWGTKVPVQTRKDARQYALSLV